MTQTIKMDSLDTAVFVCPECKKTKTLQLSAYKVVNPRSKVKCKCSCGYSSIVILEKKFVNAEPTHLTGTFMTNQKTKNSGGMIIKKLNSIRTTKDSIKSHYGSKVRHFA